MNNQSTTPTTETIWRELSDQLRQFIRSRVTSAADVDDILQTAFLRIHAKLHELKRVEKLEAWVFQITRNAITDHYRKRRDSGEDVTLMESPLEHETENFNAEIAQCIGSLINHLPKDQRQAVTLYELESLPQKEIAIREGLSLSGAKSRIQRGRRMLETMLRACCQFQVDRRGNVLEWESVGDSGYRENCECGDGPKI